MNKLDIETIIICAVMAIIGTLGILAGGAAFAGIRFQECDMAVVIGILFGASGMMWGILLILNRKQWVKTA